MNISGDRAALLALALLVAAVGARGERGRDEPAPADDELAPDDADADDDHQLALDLEESRNVLPRAYAVGGGGAAGGGGGFNALPSGFRPSASLAELAGYHARPAAQQRPSPSPSPARPSAAQREQQQEEEEREEEREEPDRLAALLQQSRFDCTGKQTGYYADQELACEVFHYCQDSVKHSWICPDGFTFHQVHLICMPPTHDNICQQSAKYHFVNEYLYRPVNQDEVDRKPNVSLKYSDRYFPVEVYRDDRYDDDDETEEERADTRGAVGGAGARAQAAAVVAAGAGAGGRPAPAQVFRAPEEVNIPLLQRRPQRPYEFDF